MDPFYFDNAATTALAPEVLEAMLPYLSGEYGNPSSVHGPGRRARLAVETARKTIAELLGCAPSAIYFTSGGTESANLAIRRSLGDLSIHNVISSPTEHACVLDTLQKLNQSTYCSLSLLEVNADGTPDFRGLERFLDQGKHSPLVCLMNANNETGTRIDLSQVGEYCRDAGAIFFSDCVQTVGHDRFDLSRTPVDMITASAHKFHGPKGTGLLYLREGLKLSGLLTGGGQERGLRSGTENVPGIVGMAKALELSMARLEEDSRQIGSLKLWLAGNLRRMGAVINGTAPENSLYTVLNAGFTLNEFTEKLMLELDMAGVAVSGGSACSASKGASHVMRAIGAAERINLRFSFSRYNTIAEVDKLILLLEQLLNCERAQVTLPN